jgi:hypothetical protein
MAASTTAHHRKSHTVAHPTLSPAPTLASVTSGSTTPKILDALRRATHQYADHRDAGLIAMGPAGRSGPRCASSSKRHERESA